MLSSNRLGGGGGQVQLQLQRLLYVIRTPQAVVATMYRQSTLVIIDEDSTSETSDIALVESAST